MQHQQFQFQESQIRRLLVSAPNLDNEALATQAESRFIHPREVTGTDIEVARRRNIQQNAFQNAACLRRQCYCSCHTLQTISGGFWSVRFPLKSMWSSCSHTSCANYKRASFWISLNRICIPYAIEASLDLMWTANKTSIAPSFEVKRVVDWNAPVSKLLRDIPWNRMSFEDARTSITQIFEAGLASPVDVRPDGQSLLEVSTILDFQIVLWPDISAETFNFPLG
jgi:hypothetical protein